MIIRRCTKNDFDHILTHFGDYWDADAYSHDMYQTIRHLHHPTWIQEFGDTAYVATENDLVIGYLFSCLSQVDPLTAYGILFAIHRDHRRRSVGTTLSKQVFEMMKLKGCRYFKAVTTPDNSASICMHEGMGFEFVGEPNVAGVPVVTDYAGPGEDRVVFIKRL